MNETGPAVGGSMAEGQVDAEGTASECTPLCPAGHLPHKGGDQRSGDFGQSPTDGMEMVAPAAFTGRPRVLNPDKETIERFEDFGYQKTSLRVAARELGVDPQTVRNFFLRAPEAELAFKKGGKERHEEEVAVWRERRAKLAAEKAQAKEMTGTTRANTSSHLHMDDGEPCPTCGHVPQSENDTITFTVAELAETRRQFEELIDRHIAARRAAEAAGNAE